LPAGGADTIAACGWADAEACVAAAADPAGAAPGAGEPGVAAAAPAAVPVPGAVAIGAISEAPHPGHTIHAASSMILRQFTQRLGENGST
jgi:hypothetical protein